MRCFCEKQPLFFYGSELPSICLLFCRLRAIGVINGSIWRESFREAGRVERKYESRKEEPILISIALHSYPQLTCTLDGGCRGIKSGRRHHRRRDLLIS